MQEIFSDYKKEIVNNTIKDINLYTSYKSL